MEPTAPVPDGDLLKDAPDFSIVLGGPLFRILCRAHLCDDALLLAPRRIVAISLFAWLPLLLISSMEGQAGGNGTAVPFLLDWEVHIRFLVAMPLLIAAEPVVHRQLRPFVRQFLERALVPEQARARFDAAIASAVRLRNSVLAEVLLVVFVYTVGILIVWRQYFALGATTWYATPSPGGTGLSLAGMWYGYVSLPLFQFLLCRWYFRLFIWARFLWQVSRIELHLIPTHPDRVAGLGFLSDTAYTAGLLALAHGALLAGQLAVRIFYLGATLPSFKTEIAVMVLLLLGAVLGPTLVFMPQLLRTKLAGNLEYGTLAERYVREFDAKWLRGGAPAEEPLVGSSDIQSLADLRNSVDIVRTMRLAPVTMEAVIGLGATTLLPVAPLVFTMMPLHELLRNLAGLIF